MTETTDQVQPAAPTKGKWWETPAYQRFHKWAMIVFAVIMIDESSLPHERVLLHAVVATIGISVLAHGFNNTIGFVAFFLVGPIHGFW